MADTRLMRQRLEAEIITIKEKLRAIEIVEAMSAELGLNGHVGMVRQQSLPTPHTNGSMPTIQAACKTLAVADPGRQWTVSTMTPEAQRINPEATRANVTTALRRLAKQGVLEVMSRNKRIGYVYRAKTTKAAP